MSLSFFSAALFALKSLPNQLISNCLQNLFSRRVRIALEHVKLLLLKESFPGRWKTAFGHNPTTWILRQAQVRVCWSLCGRDTRCKCAPCGKHRLAKGCLDASVKQKWLQGFLALRCRWSRELDSGRKMSRAGRFYSGWNFWSKFHSQKAAGRQFVFRITRLGSQAWCRKWSLDIRPWSWSRNPRIPFFWSSSFSHFRYSFSDRNSLVLEGARILEIQGPSVELLVGEQICGAQDPLGLKRLNFQGAGMGEEGWGAALKYVSKSAEAWKSFENFLFFILKSRKRSFIFWKLCSWCASARRLSLNNLSNRGLSAVGKNPL